MALLKFIICNLLDKRSALVGHCTARVGRYFGKRRIMKKLTPSKPERNGSSVNRMALMGINTCGLAVDGGKTWTANKTYCRPVGCHVHLIGG